LKIPEVVKTNKTFEHGPPLNKDYFDFLVQLGSGAFGKVYKV